jgi:hypothetical protein
MFGADKSLFDVLVDTEAAASGCGAAISLLHARMSGQQPQQQHGGSD